MFQEPRLLPWQRVAANVEVGLSHAPRRRRPPPPGASRRSPRSAWPAARSDWPAILSGGQKQRVALARALVSHPRILAFDEPLGALDALTRIEMQALIEQVWQDKGFTAIVVTHDVSEAVALADRILLLDAGRVAMDVTVDLPRPAPARRSGSRGDRRADPGPIAQALTWTCPQCSASQLADPCRRALWRVTARRRRAQGAISAAFTVIASML